MELNSNDNPNSRTECPLSKYEVLTNKKKEQCIKLPSNSDETGHQIHESKKSTHLPMDKGLGQVLKLRGVQCVQDQNKEHSPSQLDHEVCFFRPLDDEFEKRRLLTSDDVLISEGEEVLKHSTFSQLPTIINNNINTSELSMLPKDSTSSLICKMINHEGEPVKVNEEVISDKLILSCYPNKFCRPEFERSRLPKIKNLDDNHKYLTDKQTIRNTVIAQPHSETYPYTNKYQSYGKKELSKLPVNDQNTSTSSLIYKMNLTGEPVKFNDQIISDELCCGPCYKHEKYKHSVPLDQEGVLKYDYTSDQDSKLDDLTTIKMDNVEQYDEGKGKTMITGTSNFYQEISHFEDHSKPTKDMKFDYWCKTRKCEEKRKHLKVVQCAFLIVNIILMLTGIALLILTLRHILYNDYINVVLERKGLVLWIWTAFVLSILIIVIAINGILTSIFGIITMILLYCIMAGILAILILIFLFLFWSEFNLLKTITYHSMNNTKKMYRCNHSIRNAWDTLQEEFKCCGTYSRDDWKFIPSSCCNADTNTEKLACNTYVIDKNQAFQRGCDSGLDNYFVTKFFPITFCLVLALIFLLFGILAAWQFLKWHKRVLACKDMHIVTT